MKLVQTTQKLFDNLHKQYIKCNDNLNIILNDSFENDEDIDKRTDEFNSWYTQDLSSVNNMYLKLKEELENLESQYNLYISNQQKSATRVQMSLVQVIENNFNDEVEVINEETVKLIQIEIEAKEKELSNIQDNDEANIIQKYNSRINNLENQKTTKINTEKSIKDTMIMDTNMEFNNNKGKIAKQQQDELDSFEKLKTKSISSIEHLIEDIKASYKTIKSFDMLKI